MRRLLVSTAALLSACSQAPVSRSPVEAPSKSEYARMVAENTRRTDQYSGLHQTFQADATLLTTELQTASLKERAVFMQWDTRQYQSEREKALQEAGAYTRVFLRFFAPDREYDDLAKPKSIWKVYLDHNGNRFEGKTRKVSDKLVELQTLYPHFDRFSTAYEVTFNVPVTSVEQSDAKVVLTSSLGSAEFSFPARK